MFGNAGYSDLLADIDAINIANILKMYRTKPILTAVNEYNESGVFTRDSVIFTKIDLTVASPLCEIMQRK
ncbi:hypothetical protein St703_30180 [Sporolactobacillus terrae]|uniref:Uncharacterized protein n=1 Tax=Sporolactobacillus terrae TaxID=269673 RepID=A0A5K7X701_9BACL|nr:hypothetical protein St703_30180 [Sporolactobacillus terrae]